MFREADPTAFLAADQNFAVQHQFGNVLEPDGAFKDLQTETRRDTRKDQTLRIGSRYCSAPAFIAVHMQQQQRQSLKCVDVLPCLIDDAKTIGVTVCCQTDVTPGFEDTLSERFK